MITSIFATQLTAPILISNSRASPSSIIEILSHPEKLLCGIGRCSAKKAEMFSHFLWNKLVASDVGSCWSRLKLLKKQSIFVGWFTNSSFPSLFSYRSEFTRHACCFHHSSHCFGAQRRLPLDITTKSSAARLTRDDETLLIFLDFFFLAHHHLASGKLLRKIRSMKTSWWCQWLCGISRDQLMLHRLTQKLIELMHCELIWESWNTKTVQPILNYIPA